MKMKRFILLVVIIVMAFTACTKTSETQSQTATAEQTQTTSARYKIGDIGPGGGIVFYNKGNDSNGWRYMEAAVNFDITSSHAWGYFFNDIGTQTAIGTGKENTRLMLAAGAAPAAQTCVDFRGGGKNDWFLPSKDELNELYKQRNHFESTRLSFWSSSQGNEYNAWNQNFDNGNQEYNDNTNDFAYSVHAVRSFSDDTVSQGTTAETLAVQRQTADPSNPHPEILNGDLSAFAGTWASSSGIGVILRPDGIFATASNMHYWKEAGGFNRGADSFSGSWASNGIDYHWNIYDEEGRYIGIVLFPVGVGVRYGGTDLPSDTTRARIYSYQHDAYPANEYLYYRVGEAASQSQPQEPADLTGEWHYRSITGSCHGQEHYIFTADGYYRKGDFYQQHDGTWSLVRDTATGKYHLTLQYKHFIDFESGWSPNEFTDNSEYETIDPNNINLLFHGTVRKELTRCNNPGWNAQ